MLCSDSFVVDSMNTVNNSNNIYHVDMYEVCSNNIREKELEKCFKA